MPFLLFQLYNFVKIVIFPFSFRVIDLILEINGQDPCTTKNSAGLSIHPAQQDREEDLG